MFGWPARLHDLPGVAMIADMPPPGQRLVADAHASFRRQLAKRVEIFGRPVNPAEGCAATRWSRQA